MNKLELYDTTLRDGTQQQRISLSVEDKIAITKKLFIQKIMLKPRLIPSLLVDSNLQLVKTTRFTYRH